MSQGNPFDLLKTVYTKDKVCPRFEDVGILIWLNTYLSLDKNSLTIVKDLSPYLFYVSPRHYFYLLYFSISYSSRPPFLKKPAKKPVKENALIDRIQLLLGWSNREMRLNYHIIEQLFLKDKATQKFWKQELGSSYG